MQSRLSKSSNRLSTQSNRFQVLIKNRVNHEKMSSSRYATETCDKLEEEIPTISFKAQRQQSQNLAITTSTRQDKERKPTTDLMNYVKNMKKTNPDWIPNDCTQRSRASVCSRYSTRSVAKSETSGIPLAFNSNNVKQSSILELEEKLEEIVKNKLIKAAKSNPFPHSRKPTNQLDQQLKDLTKEIKQLKVLRNTQDQPEQISEDLNNLCRKIAMLQKIIAESTTESELMKKFYHHQRIHRKPSLVNKLNFTLYKSANILTKLSASGFCYSPNIANTRKQIGYQTTTNISYQKPAKNDYESFKHTNATFRLNRQPIQRSTYSCEYLTYGTMPKYRHKEGHSVVKMDKANVCLGSTYKNDFKTIKNAKGAKIDYKYLDCYRDKFKNVKVSFMQSCRKNITPPHMLKKHKDRDSEFCQSSQKLLKQHKGANLQRSLNNLKNPSETMNNFMRTSHMSQTKKQFVNKSLGVSSVIKDKNLNCLKNSYKAMLRA